MEESSTRAIVIAVSLFMTVAVISALIMYYNVTLKGAVSLAQSASKVDSASEFEYILKDDVTTATYTGVEFRSLIRKYAGVSNVVINVYGIGLDVNNSWLKTGYENTISEVELLKIDITKKANITKSTVDGNLVINATME